MSERAVQNTDREIFRETDDYYSPSVSVTENGLIQLHVGGWVIAKKIEDWYNLASKCQSCGGNMFFGRELKENHLADCNLHPEQGDKLMVERMTKYHALVHPVNLHSSYGKRVVVMAKSYGEAVARAKELSGWGGKPENARVLFTLIEDTQ